MLTLTALIVVPGFVICLLGGVRVGYALVAAIPVSYGVVSISCFVLGMMEIRWNLLTYAISALIAAVVVWLVGSIVRGPLRLGRGRRFGLFRGAGRRRRRHAREEGVLAEDELSPRRKDPRSAVSDHPDYVTGWRSWIWKLAPFLAVVVSAWLIATLVLNQLVHTTGGLSNVFQGWDAHWHANYLRFIAETGIASPEDAGLLHNQESHTPMYYPSAWHAIAALVYNLTGANVVETYNLVQIGAAAIAFPLGVASFTWVMCARRMGRMLASTAATAAALMTPLFPGLPFVEMRVAATPSALSAGLVGAVVLIIIASTRRPAWCLPAGLALIGVGGLHPSGLVTAALIVIFWWLFEALWRPTRGRLRDLLSLATVAILGMLVLIPQFLSISANAEDISSFSFTTGGSRWMTWVDSISLQVRHVRDFGVRWVVLAIALLGLLVLIRRGIVWALALWAFFIVVCVNAMQPIGNVVGDAFHLIGSVYYNDPRRVGVVLAVIVAACAGLGIASFAHWVVSQMGKLVDPITDPYGRGAGSMRYAVLIVVVIGTTVWSAQSAPLFAERAATEQRYGKLVDTHDLRAFDWLATQPKAYDGTILTNANEGSGWMYATNGLPSISRHYLDPPFTETGTNQLLDTIDLAGRLKWTDDAIDRLDVNYVYVSPPPHWGYQPFNKAMLAAFTAPGLQMIYADRQIRIYAVRAHFSQQELDRMVADSPHPPGIAQEYTRETEQSPSDAPVPSSGSAPSPAQPPGGASTPSGAPATSGAPEPNGTQSSGSAPEPSGGGASPMPQWAGN